MSWETAFVDRLTEIRLPNVFNPYVDHCEVHDLPDAALIRSKNLALVLGARHAEHIESIWFGRDLGYRGGRRTGLAFTDELTMLHAVSAARDGFTVSRATRGSAVAERTAAVIWSVIQRLRHTPFLWNAFPFHPHKPEEALSNRAHSNVERRETAWAIEALVDRFDRPRLIAVGNDASQALTDLGFEHEKVRHPSYGGQREFISKMECLHSLTPL